MRKLLATALVALAPLCAQTIVIKNATVMTVAKGTFKGTVVVKDGKIAQVGEQVMEPRGRHRNRRQQPVPDSGHHRLPLAHRHRRRRERGQRVGILDGQHPRRAEPRRHRDLPRAGGRSDHRQHPARIGQRHRRLHAADQAALGQGRRGAGLSGSDAGHQVRAGRESQARRKSAGRARRRGNHRDRALSRDPHGRGGRHPRGVQRSQGLQGGMGRLRRQSGARRASHPSAQGSEARAAEGSARRQALRALPIATAPTRS